MTQILQALFKQDECKMHPQAAREHSRSNPLHPLLFAIKTKNRMKQKYIKSRRKNEIAGLIYPSSFYFHLRSREVVGQSTYRTAPAPHWPVWMENIFSKMEQKRRVGNSAFCFLRVAFLIRVEDFVESGRLSVILITLASIIWEGSHTFHFLFNIVILLRGKLLS